MSSSLPIIAAALAYIWAAYLALQDPVALSGFSGSIDLGTLTKGFSSETAVACTWAHFIAQVGGVKHVAGEDWLVRFDESRRLTICGGLLIDLCHHHNRNTAPTGPVRGPLDLPRRDA